MWVVVDADFELQPDAAAFLASVRGREDASVNTERAYAGQVALYLSYCAERGIGWADPSLGQLSGFLNWLVNEPWSVPGGNMQGRERFRSRGTANAITGTVFRFLRFCSLLDDSPVPADVAARLYEPRYLAFAPPGYDRGEGGQYAVVNVRTLRFKVAVSGYEYLTDEEVRVIMGFTAHARDRLLVVLLAVTGCFSWGAKRTCCAFSCFGCSSPWLVSAGAQQVWWNSRRAPVPGLAAGRCRRVSAGVQWR